MKFMELHELLDMQFKDDYLIDQIFGGQPGEYMLIVGPSGVGKSYFAIDLACHIALGRSWFGFGTKARTVSYVALEGTYREFQKRMRVFSKTYPGIVENKLVKFGLVEESIKLTKDSNIIEEWAQGCDILIIDPLKFLVQGDFCKPKDAMAFVSNLQEESRKCSIPVILCHHMRKKGSDMHLEPDDLDNIKGPTEYADHASTVIVFGKSKNIRGERGKFTDSSDNYRTAYFPKARDAGGKIENIELEWLPKGYNFLTRG